MNSTNSRQDFDNKSKYHDINCCSATRGIDNLLESYREDRDIIIELIMTDPDKLIQSIWKPTGPLAIDNECKCRMGEGDILTSFLCAQCRNIKRLTDFRVGGVEKPFQIQCGKYTGTDLIVGMSEITTPFLSWDQSSIRRAHNYYLQHPNAVLCGASVKRDTRCIVGDSFTIRTLILWTILRIFTDKGLPHSPVLHTAFICHNVGYSLYNDLTIGSIDRLHEKDEFFDDVKINQSRNGYSSLEPAIQKLSLFPTRQLNTTSLPTYQIERKMKSEVTRSIFIQLLVILKELQQINFSHGTPSIHGLIFDKEPVSYIYDDVHITGPFTLQITDLWNASATLANVHYYPKNIKTTFSLDREFFIPEITTKQATMAYCDDNVIIGTDKLDIACPSTSSSCPDTKSYDVCEKKRITFYKLTSSTINIYNAIRHSGFPLYSGSFDCYCFIVSLMCDKTFYNSVMQDQSLYRLWSMMWIREDLIRVENLISNVFTKNYVSNPRANGTIVIDIIKESWLRCDIIDHLWNLIKIGW